MGYIVGLTGGIGSGKSMISELFASQGVPIIDADVVARQVVEKGSPILAEIVKHFGEHILKSDGELDRNTLRLRVFNNEAEKLWLNNLLHPAIRQEMLKQLTEIKSPYVLWVVPLLIENKLTAYCDRVLVIDVDPEIQLTRASQRDSNTQEVIKKIMQSQVEREVRLSYADDIIDNSLPISLNLSKIKDKVSELHHLYLKLAKEKTEDDR